MTRWVHGTEFLAGVWGIKNDEIAVVTIKQKDDDTEDSSIEEITITDPGISIWDAAGVLGIPLVLFILGAWLQHSQQKQSTDEAREEVLQTYFDRISALLVEKNLMAIAAKEKSDTPSILTTKNQPEINANERRTPEEQELLDAARDVIRARTLSILRRFKDDIERKSSVLQFLIEAEIVSKLKLNLTGADLTGIDLAGADLIGANLTGANLTGANLTGAFLA